MLKRVTLIGVAWLLSCLLNQATAAWAAPPTQGNPIDPALQAALVAQSSNQTTPVIVILADQLDPKTVKGRDQADIKKNLVNALQKKADSTQLNLRKLTQARHAQGLVQNITPLWIQNAISLQTTATVINELARQPEVARIIPDTTFQAPSNTSGGLVGPNSATPETNISKINAPAVWAQGFTGQNVVIASLDTGVDVTHPDLSAQYMNDSNSWFDPYGQNNLPTDINGHGTQTMGVLVGRDNGGTSIGVAPNARWIAAKIFNNAGTATATAIHQAFQWVLNNPDNPRLVNNSWSSNTGGCDLQFQADLQSLLTAGIVPVFAAGNSGPGSGTGVSPANNPEAFAVGDTNNNDAIDSSSSQGPTSCGSGATGRTWPHLVAPGVNINTSDSFLHGYTTATGTSLAAPHVTGAMALLLSANPNLSVVQLETALTATTLDLGATGADNIYGAGRLDVLAACNSLNLCNSPYLITTSNDSGGGQGTLVYALTQAAANATIEAPITINFSPAVSTYTVTANLPALGAYVTVNGGCTNGTPNINLLAGSGAGNNGLATTASGNATIKGLAVSGFSGYGLSIAGPDNELLCSWLGLKKDNTVARNTQGPLHLLTGGRLKIANNPGGNGTRIIA